jgi:tetratricopeptide (TPR) repeat protein
VNPESYARWQIWQRSAQAVARNPLGYGLGLYQYIYPRYAFPVEGQILRYGKVAQTAHNEYLQIAVELGVIGLAVFCFGILQVVREVRMVLRLRLRRWQRSLAIGVSGGISGVLAHAVIDSNLHEPGIVIVLIVAVAILCSVRRLSTGIPGPSTRFIARPRWVWAGCSLLLLLTVGMAVLKHGAAWLFFESGSRAQAERDIARAIADYQVAVSLDYGKALYHSSLAAARFQEFQQTLETTAAQAAIDEMLTAIRQNPLDGRLAGILGHVYGSLATTSHSGFIEKATQEQLEAKAILAYEQAKQLEPFSPLHRLELARLYLDRGEQQKAFAEAGEALELEPNCLVVREWLARALLASGSPDDVMLARRQIQEIIDRQRRYAKVPKNSLEMKYMSVRSADLVAELGRAQPQES